MPTAALFTLSVVFFLLDQASKRFAQNRLAYRTAGWEHVVRFHPVAHIRDSYSNTTKRVLFVLSWFAALALSMALYRSSIKLHSPAAALGLALALSGAAGNLTDILRCNCVLNFIDLKWWPAFNLADAGITVGFSLILWQMIWG
jgi:signal peptidase II